MHLAFIDIASAYAADRPDGDEPFGGTGSAVCFTARELAKVGIRCTLFNKIRKPTTAHGVTALPLETLMDDALRADYTHFIFCGRWTEWLVKFLSESSASCIAWMHESVFGGELTPPLKEFDSVVYVSEWQKRINQPYVQAHWQQTVIRNAMNPAAANLFAPGEAILPAKTKVPVLMYVGATPRGLLHMPRILEALHRKRSDYTVEIYSACAPTQDADANENFAAQLRSLPNVTHVGAVGQAQLLQNMKRAAFMMAPNPWPETSCIAMMEALTAGLGVITTNRAALPETSFGFARHITMEDADHPTRFDMPMPCDEFAEAINLAMDEWLQKPEETERKLQAQRNYFLELYQWPQRAEEWIEFFATANSRLNPMRKAFA